MDGMVSQRHHFIISSVWWSGFASSSGWVKVNPLQVGLISQVAMDAPVAVPFALSGDLVVVRDARLAEHAAPTAQQSSA